jgi:hypothetical protein
MYAVLWNRRSEEPKLFALVEPKQEFILVPEPVFDQDPTCNGIRRSTNKNERLTLGNNAASNTGKAGFFAKVCQIWIRFGTGTGKSEGTAVYHHGSTTLKYEMKIFSQKSCDTVSYNKL